MGLNEAQKKERSEYLENNLIITECSQRKPYVFISYASDNWETVFKSAIVPMQKQYGLRVYADKAFDKVNDKWIVPMLRNVRGADVMVAFVSQSYIESYACFLELLTAVNNKKQIVFVSLEQQLHLGDTTDLPEVERGVKNEILNQGANIATNVNNTSNDLMRAMKSAFTSLSTLLEQDALSKYDISDAFINFFRDASINKKTINDLNAVMGTIASVSRNVFDQSMAAEKPATRTVSPEQNKAQTSQTFHEAPPADSQPAPAYQEPTQQTAYTHQQPITQNTYTYQQPAAQNTNTYQQPTRQGTYDIYQQPAQQQTSATNDGKQPKTDTHNKKFKIILAAVGVCLLAVIGIIIVSTSSKNVKNVTYRSGVDTGVYSGQWKHDMPNGQGTITWNSDGSTYTGEWENGLENGQGTYTYVNGDSYTGELVNGLANGQGTFKGSDGSVYIGEWVDGLINGQGTNTYANGDTYTGEWKDNYPHGQGTMTYADGTVLSGTWQDGKFIQ